MRLASLSRDTDALAQLPLWPPLLATSGPGSASAPHSHHAMHLVLATKSTLRVRAGGSRPARETAGVLTAPDVAHSIDSAGADVLLVFLDPESDAGAALRGVLDGPLRLVTDGERDAIVRAATSPMEIMHEAGVSWVQKASAILGAAALPSSRTVHPRVKKVLRLLRDSSSERETSLEALAKAVDLSPGRLMHAFTDSIGLPLRPYLAWLKLQRAAGAIVSGSSLTDAAHAAGFSDAGHMTRTFRRMLGMPPSALRRVAPRVAS